MASAGGNPQAVMERLQEGKLCDLRPQGNSMEPLIKSGQKVALQPIQTVKELKKGDIVFCRVKGKFLVHKITNKNTRTQKYEISNNKGFVNGEIPIDSIYGLVVEIVPYGKAGNKECSLR